MAASCGASGSEVYLVLLPFAMSVGVSIGITLVWDF